MQKLIRKLLILTVLLAMPVALSFTGSRQVQAATTCCSVCDNDFQACEDGCPPELPHGCPWCGRAYTICEKSCNPGC